MKRLLLISLIIYVFCRNTGYRINNYAPAIYHRNLYKSYIYKLDDPKTKAKPETINFDQFRTLAKEIGFATRDDTIYRQFIIMDTNKNNNVEQEEFVKARTDEDYKNNVILGGLVIFLVTKFRVQVIFSGLLLFSYWALVYLLNNLAEIDL